MTTEGPPSRSGPPSSGTALVVRAAAAPSLADDVHIQHLWLSLHRRSWRSLAVVGASKGVPTLATANMLANMAWWYTGEPTCVFDMRDLSLRLVEHQLGKMASQVRDAKRVFVALRSTSENATAVLLARAADAAVLCVELGRTDIKSAQKTIDAVGRERFLGTILVSGREASAGEAVPSSTRFSAHPAPDESGG